MSRACLLLVVLLLASAPLTKADEQPYLLVLGVGQDAGYPQAGCYAPHCLPGWENLELRRGAVSLGVVDPASGSKFLFEATPSLPAQLYQLDRAAPTPDFTLNGVFLTHAHIGHYTGLMFFGREAMGASDVPVYAMPRMRTFLENNGPWDQLLALGNIRLRPLEDGEMQDFGAIRVTPFEVPHRDEYSETVGFRIEGPSKTAIFIPDIDKWQQWQTDLRELLKTVDYGLIDAAFYADGELPGRDMSKIPHPFVSETMALLDALPEETRNKVWFIHMNHTNPLLQDNSPERREVLSRGYHVAGEGDRLPL